MSGQESPYTPGQPTVPRQDVALSPFTAASSMPDSSASAVSGRRTPRRSTFDDAGDAALLLDVLSTTPAQSVPRVRRERRDAAATASAAAAAAAAAAEAAQLVAERLTAGPVGELRQLLGDCVIGLEEEVLMRMHPQLVRLQEERAAAALRDPPRSEVSAWQNQRWSMLGGWDRRTCNPPMPRRGATSRALAAPS